MYNKICNCSMQWACQLKWNDIWTNNNTINNFKIVMKFHFVRLISTKDNTHDLYLQHAYIQHFYLCVLHGISDNFWFTFNQVIEYFCLRIFQVDFRFRRNSFFNKKNYDFYQIRNQKTKSILLIHFSIIFLLNSYR